MANPLIWRFKKKVTETVTYNQVIAFLKLREGYLGSYIYGMERSKKLLLDEWSPQDEIELKQLKSRRREISKLMCVFSSGKKYFPYSYYYDKLSEKLEDMKAERLKHYRATDSERRN